MLKWGMIVRRPTSQANTKAPGRPLTLSVYLTFVFEFELCTSRAPQGPVPVQATKKSKMPLRLQKAILVCSNYITHTFNLYGHVTMSYLLWHLPASCHRWVSGPLTSFASSILWHCLQLDTHHTNKQTEELVYCHSFWPSGLDFHFALHAVCYDKIHIIVVICYFSKQKWWPALFCRIDKCPMTWTCSHLSNTQFNLWRDGVA